MTTNDKPLTRNYDSDKKKSEIDSDIRVLKIRQRGAAHSARSGIAFYTKVKLSVSIDPGGGGDSHLKQTGMLVVSLRGVNFGFWSRLGCPGQSANILCRQGLA